MTRKTSLDTILSAKVRLVEKTNHNIARLEDKILQIQATIEICDRKIANLEQRKAELTELETERKASLEELKLLRSQLISDDSDVVG